MKLVLAAILFIGFAAAYPDRNSRIVGGLPVNPDTAPFVVSLQIDRAANGNFAHLCGASILAETWVITAAHCIDKNGRGSIYRVIAGQYDLAVPSANQQIRSVNNIQVHPGFSLVPDYGPNDVALLGVSAPFVWITGAVDVALLPFPESTPEGEGTLFGWGSTSGDSVQLPTRLQMLVKPIMPVEVCRELVGGHTIYDSHVCTEPSPGQQGPCEHDAGGPLVLYYFGYVSLSFDFKLSKFLFEFFSVSTRWHQLVHLCLSMWSCKLRERLRRRFALLRLDLLHYLPSNGLK